MAKIKLQFGSKIKMTKFVTDFSPRNLKFHNRTDANWEQENTVNWYQYFCFSRSVQICMEVTWSLTTPMMKQKVRYKLFVKIPGLRKLGTWYIKLNTADCPSGPLSRSPHGHLFSRPQMTSRMTMVLHSLWKSGTMTHNSTKSQCFYFRFLTSFLMCGFKINSTEYNFKIFRHFSLGCYFS